MKEKEKKRKKNDRKMGAEAGTSSRFISGHDSEPLKMGKASKTVSADEREGDSQKGS